MVLISLFRYILGAIFLVSGASKIPIFDAFAYSITELAPLRGTFLTMAAVGVISIEIVAGAGLVFNKWPRFFGGILALMLVSFVILLSSALFRYESYVCTCFGVLGLKLPVVEQIIVDMILLSMALSVVLYSRPPSKVFEVKRHHAHRIMTSVIIASVVWATLIILQPRVIFGEKPPLAINTQMVFNELPPTDSFQPRLVFVIDMADFLCPDCVADFVGMAQRITEHSQGVRNNVFIFVRPVEFLDRDEQHVFIEEWRAEHDYPFVMPIDTNDIFTRAGFEKSTVLLYTGLGSLEDVETFPMGSRRRNEILDRFLRPFRN